jgi:hypothetical protein
MYSLAVGVCWCRMQALAALNFCLDVQTPAVYLCRAVTVQCRIPSTPPQAVLHCGCVPGYLQGPLCGAVLGCGWGSLAQILHVSDVNCCRGLGKCVAHAFVLAQAARGALITGGR